MPLAPPRPCLRPGCGKLVPKGYCETHEPQDVRPSYARRTYHTATGDVTGGFDRTKWDRARRDFLRRNPCCAEHLKTGKNERATVVDHITPHRGDRGSSGTRRTGSRSVMFATTERLHARTEDSVGDDVGKFRGRRLENDGTSENKTRRRSMVAEVSERPTLSTQPPPCPSGLHCWHRNRSQHLVKVYGGEHRDEQCCNCGTKRCRNIIYGVQGEHGPWREK